MSQVDDDKSRLILNQYKISENLPKQDSLFDQPFNIHRFRKCFQVVVIHNDKETMEFDMLGINTAFANAFRRIIISEVPSMAIEHVHIYNNTSLIQDEMLSHRMGLIPLKADPRLFNMKEANDEGGPNNTLEFALKIKCTKNKEETKKSHRADDKFKNNKVYSSHVTWVPNGNQADNFEAADVGPIHKDILIAKMRPNQEIDLKLFAVKGIGLDHIKFSPVCTAYYRLAPDIKIVKEVKGEAAERLQSCFSKGVIGLQHREDDEVYAVVTDPRNDSSSRNIYNHADLADSVIITNIRDHIIFTIESVGAMTPDVIFKESVAILKNKAVSLLSQLEEVK